MWTVEVVMWLFLVSIPCVISSPGLGPQLLLTWGKRRSRSCTSELCPSSSASVTADLARIFLLIVRLGVRLVGVWLVSLVGEFSARG